MKYALFPALFIPMNVLADTPNLATSTLGVGQLLQTFLGLIVVLLFIGALAWLLKRSQYLNQANAGQLRIVSAISLGPRERAIVVQLGDQQLLLGVTTHNINLLHTLAEPLDIKHNTPLKGAFADKLKRALHQQKAS